MYCTHNVTVRLVRIVLQPLGCH